MNSLLLKQVLTDPSVRPPKQLVTLAIDGSIFLLWANSD